MVLFLPSKSSKNHVMVHGPFGNQPIITIIRKREHTSFKQRNKYIFTITEWTRRPGVLHGITIGV